MGVYLTDCLGPVMYLRRDPHSGAVSGSCPSCGADCTALTTIDGRFPDHLQVAGETIFGHVRLVPCGCEVGQIEIHPDERRLA